jgi:hypothetical protein
MALGSLGSQGGIFNTLSGTAVSIPTRTSRIAQRYDIARVPLRSKGLLRQASTPEWRCAPSCSAGARRRQRQQRRHHASANAALNDSQFFIRIPRLARVIHGWANRYMP